MPYERIRTRADLRRFLDRDAEAHGRGPWKFTMRISRPQLHYQRLLRRTEYWDAQPGPLAKAMWVVLRLRLAFQSQRLGLSVPPGVFGPGLCIRHYGTIVVNDKARFGADCVLHASTNIGERGGAAPQAGDNVYIGPGAVLYGGIELGDHVMVGANSVVNKSFPDHAVIAGAPARIIGGS